MIAASELLEGTSHMNPYNPYAPQMSRDQVSADSNAFLRKVYAFMAAGLLATALTATAVASSESMVRALVTNPILFYGLIIAELGVVVAFSSLASKLSTPVA